jgi:hypothetical protein
MKPCSNSAALVFHPQDNKKSNPTTCFRAATTSVDTKLVLLFQEVHCDAELATTIHPEDRTVLGIFAAPL